MFDALPLPSQRIWLIALLIIWALLLFGGFALGGGNPARRMPTWTRMTSSATLVVAAFSWALFARNTAVSGYALLVALGMTWGLIGDLWLAGLLPGGRNVIGGMVAFGIGHLFYISAFLRFSSVSGLNAPTARWGALAFWLLIGAVGWYLVVYRDQPATTITWVALPYALLLSTTAGLATSIALQEPRFIPLAVGAALFLLSDLILAGELFAGLDFPLIGDVIWLTYGPAQMLIVYSVGLAMTFTRTG